MTEVGPGDCRWNAESEGDEGVPGLDVGTRGTDGSHVESREAAGNDVGSGGAMHCQLMRFVYFVFDEFSSPSLLPNATKQKGGTVHAKVDGQGHGRRRRDGWDARHGHARYDATAS